MLGRRSLALACAVVAVVGPVPAAVAAAPPPEPVRLLPADGSDGDQFGDDVAVSGDTLVVGAPQRGTVYVYVRSGDGWVEQAALRNPRAVGFGGFGSVVDVDGDTLAVSAPARNTGRGNWESGTVYVLERTGTRWSLTAKIEELEISAFRGSQLALDGDSLLIGVPGVSNSFYGYNRVDVYTRNTEGWVQTDTLVDPTPDGNDDGFGSRLVADRGSAVLTSDGGLLTYKRVGEAWSYRSTVPDVGGTLALSFNTLVVGIREWRDSGEIQVYRRSGDSWTLQQVLPAPATFTEDDDFATSVALGGGFIAVGAPHYDTSPKPPRIEYGSVAVYVQQGAGWVEHAILRPETLVPSDFFGLAMAAEGQRLFVGAPDYPTIGAGPGAVYVYDNAPRTSSWLGYPEVTSA